MFKVTSPFGRFRQLLQHLIPSDNEAAHVGCQKKPVGHRAQKAERRLKFKTVAHQRAVRVFDEPVVVDHALESRPELLFLQRKNHCLEKFRVVGNQLFQSLREDIPTFPAV